MTENDLSFGIIGNLNYVTTLIWTEYSAETRDLKNIAIVLVFRYRNADTIVSCKCAVM